MSHAPTVSETATYGLFIGGSWETPGETMPVKHKYTGVPIAHVAKASREDVTRAVGAARHAFEHTAFPPNLRYKVLLKAAQLLQERKELFTRTLMAEGGKIRRDAALEAERAVETFTVSAEEAKRIAGHEVPVAGQEGADNRLAFTIRVPVGVIAAITPFNFPINLVAHKIGPALAAGNSVVLKPASSTPLCAVLLCQVLQDAGLPPGRLNLITGSGASVGGWLLEDERIAMYTFTGSTEIGLEIKAKSGLRRTTLELGSNAANLVFPDADVEKAADILVRKGMQNAGQMCISVQRILVHKSVEERFLAAATAVARTLKTGDPEDALTDVGPLITESEAQRAEEWVQEAVAQGARLVAGGKRYGTLLEPTVLAGVKSHMRVACQEVFAPVVSVMTFETDDEALALANDSLYGLQAGVFTRDLDRAMRFGRELEVGGVIINDSSAFRADLMPYGGVKGSGIGREGPKYAIEEMTDQRLIVFNL